jgi:hypothetical protein
MGMGKFLPSRGFKRGKILPQRVNGDADEDEEAFSIPVPRGDPQNLHVMMFYVIVNDKNKLVGCPYVATIHNNTHVNFPPKRSQVFLLIVSALRIIFFLI